MRRTDPADAWNAARRRDGPDGYPRSPGATSVEGDLTVALSSTGQVPDAAGRQKSNRRSVDCLVLLVKSTCRPRWHRRVQSSMSSAEMSRWCIGDLGHSG